MQIRPQADAPFPLSDLRPVACEGLTRVGNPNDGGYVVPLDFEATNVKEFLLVPFVGACIHVPPPPPNQIIYVKTAQGFDVEGSFDPVYVTGTLKVASQYTGLAETGYAIDADKVETRKE